MPLRPLHISQSGSPDANRIAPNSLLEYEQHGRPLLAAALAERKGRWLIVNEEETELELPANRLYLLPGQVPRDAASPKSKAAYLKGLLEKAAQEAKSLNLGDVWEVVLGEVKELSAKEIAEVGFGDNSTVHHIAVRRLLISGDGTLYFKRKKNGFEPRPADVVEQLRLQAEAERQREEKRRALIESIIAKLEDPRVELPDSAAKLEQLAALGKDAEDYRASEGILNEIIEKSGLSITGRVENKAFNLLAACGHFSRDQNLSIIRYGRKPLFSDNAQSSAASLVASLKEINTADRVDLSSLTPITIDDLYTRDIDDALSLEAEGPLWRVGIHISDVAAFISKKSVLDKESLLRGSSLYCADQRIPMLPVELSENILSLVDGEKRLAMSFFITLDDRCLIKDWSILRSHLVVKHRLNYELVDELLRLPPSSAPLISKEVDETIRSLSRIATQLENNRVAQGATQFMRREMNARLTEDNRIIIEESNDNTPARKLVSELMILANTVTAVHAKKQGFPIIYRGQDPPEVNPEDEGHNIPEGLARDFFRRSFLKRSSLSSKPLVHSGLAVEAYTYVTSPIRRAADLVNQRQLASALAGRRLEYSEEELDEVIAELGISLDEAMQIQRERNRYWLLRYLMQENISELDAVILKTDGHRPLAELGIIRSIYPFTPIEEPPGDKNSWRARIGQTVKLQIENIDPRSDLIVLKEKKVPGKS